jgi:predicted aldo/keto reductase-like oxidoreductase
MSVTRREFIHDTAVAAGGIATLGLIEEAAGAAPERGKLPQRILGRTRRKVPIVGFGVAPLGSDNTLPDEVTRILNYGIDQGITYLDTAPVYGDPKSKYGNAEMKMKDILKTRRKEVFLVTKANAQRQTRDGMLEQIEESLKRMGVDYVDLLHIHNLGDFDMQQMFKPEGALAGLKAAREKGMVRYLGVSGHIRPQRFVELIDTGDIDVTMIALNFADRHNYPFEELVFPVAKKHGTAVVAMKVLGGAKNWSYDGKTPGTLIEHHEKAIRYSLGLPVASAVIGFANEKEVDQALSVARTFKPLPASEKRDLIATGKQLAEARGLYYGPVEG